MNELDERLTGFRKVNVGGEGVIYRAVLDGSLPVAFKWNTDEKPLNTEQVAFLMGHPIDGLARVLGCGVLENRPYLVSEYISGTPTEALSPIPPKIAVKMMREVCRTLSEMEKIGIFHGDLSPANVMVLPSGKPVLIDVGIEGLGTPRFAAPERFEGAASTTKSEIFSLGALLYYWISGETLFGGETFETIENAVFSVDSYDETLLLHGRGKLSPESLRVFQALWKGTLRKDPEERFEDFDEMDECLEIAASELSLEDSAVNREKEAIWKDELKLSIREHENQIERSPEETLQLLSQKTENSDTNGTDSNETKRSTGKFLLGGAVFLFALLLLLCIFFFRTSSSDVDVDDVGESMLKSTRSLQIGEDTRTLKQDSMKVIRGIMTDVDSLSTAE